MTTRFPPWPDMVYYLYRLYRPVRLEETMFKKNLKLRHTVFYKFIAVNILVMAVFYAITLNINARISDRQKDDLFHSYLNPVELFATALDADIA